jgi:outer membrane protein OmpA-like peptidoglycan-associated protein
MAKRRHHQDHPVELRDLGLTLAQIDRSTGRQRKSRGGALILVSIVLFAVAGGAGMYLVLGQQSRAPITASAPESVPQPPVITAPVVEAVAAEPNADIAPVNTEQLRATLSPDRPTTVASYLENLPSLGLDMPVAVVAAPAEPTPAAPTIVAATETDCVASLDAIAASLVVPFDAYSVASPNADLDQVFDLARRVADCDAAYIVVAGHADPSGDETQNLILSWQRAEFVVSALTSAGFDEGRLEAIGFGSRRPISEGAAGSDDTINRRVDFVVRAAQP